MNNSRSRTESTLRMITVAAGVIGIGWGVWLALQLSLSDLLSAGAWFVIPPVLSDLVLLPVVAVIGGVLTRRLQPWVRLPVQVALAAAGCLLFIGLPFLSGLGKRADNPSLLDRNYPLGVGVYVLIILAAAGIWALLRWRSVGPGKQYAPHDSGPVPETTW